MMAIPICTSLAMGEISSITTTATALSQTSQPRPASQVEDGPFRQGFSITTMTGSSTYSLLATWNGTRSTARTAAAIITPTVPQENFLGLRTSFTTTVGMAHSKMSANARESPRKKDMVW